ncbi:MAG: DUF2490 domain-containing protein [Flavobacteriales bacterium]
MWRKLLFLVGLLTAGGAFAQERQRPELKQELWASFGVQGRPSVLEGLLGKEVVKRLRTSAEIGYRSADSFFAGRQFYLDLGATYKISDRITAGGEYRYAYRSDDRNRQRLGGMVQYKTEVDRFDLAYRLTYQHNFREPGDVREVFRNKFIAGYNFPKWKFDPQFSVEFFTWASARGLSYFGTRFKLGSEWAIADAHTLGFGIVHDRERMVFAPQYRFILAVDYGINLRKT